MTRVKRALRFTLPLLPIAALAGFLVTQYQFESVLDSAATEQAIAQLGSLELVMVITTLQTVLYAAICGFFGYLLADRLGLIRPFGLQRQPLLQTLALSLLGGILFSLDPWVFGHWIPEVRIAAPFSFWNWSASVLYGGVVEELMLRWFFLSLLAWIIWKLFFRKRETVPTGVLVAANVLAALVFAAGHLPATVMLFGSLTPLILLRCFLLNGGFGLIFGWLYRRHGIQYAMISHATLHIVSKLIWTLFL